MRTETENLRRPRLLVRAARAALGAARRASVVAEAGPAAAGGAGLGRLREIESGIEVERRAGAAGYSPARHVTALAALLGALVAGPAPGVPGQAKASGSDALRRAT
jgi:hypothetical protein